MAEEKIKEGESENPEIEAKPGPNVALIIIVLLVAQALFVGAAIFFMSKKYNEHSSLTVSGDFADQGSAGAFPSQSSYSEQAPSAGIVSNIASEVVLPVKLDVTVNIAGAEGRYLKVKIAVAYDSRNHANKKIESGLAGIEPQLRNTAVNYLSSLTLEQLTRDLNIQTSVRVNLLKELNSTIPVNIGRLSNVYIEEWLVS